MRPEEKLAMMEEEGFDANSLPSQIDGERPQPDGEPAACPLPRVYRGRGKRRRVCGGETVYVAYVGYRVGDGGCDGGAGSGMAGGGNECAGGFSGGGGVYCDSGELGAETRFEQRVCSAADG